MVAVGVGSQVKHVALQLIDQRQQFFPHSLCPLGEDFDQGLDGSGAVDVQGDFHSSGEHSIDDLGHIFVGRDLDDLLAEVVSELVAHHLGQDLNHALDQGRNEAF